MDLSQLAAASEEMSFAQQKEDERRRAFKATHDTEDSRRKREENQIKIRKSKKEARLQKRRAGAAARLAMNSSAAEAAKVAVSGIVDSDSMSHADGVEALKRLPELVAGVRSADENLQLQYTTAFRKLLSIEQDPPIQQVINSGVVPVLREFLKKEHNTKLQFEAAWALTNIASGSSSDTQCVVAHGCIPIFVTLLRSPNEDVREQAVWALGNIAGDSSTLRDRVLVSGALIPLVTQLQKTIKLSMLRNATWTLSNFCRGKPRPPFYLVQPALDTLAKLIFSSDEEVLTDACWALSYLSDGKNDKIQAVIQSGVCRRLMDLLGHPSPAVQTPALRTIGNIVTGDDLQTQVVINCGALPCLVGLLSNNRKGIRKEACWTISNVTAGSVEQIQAVLDANLIQPLIKLLKNDAWDIRKEAAWAISNATSGGKAQQVKQLVSLGCIPPLVELLEASDSRIIAVALEGLENILRVGDLDQKEHSLAYNQHAKWVEEAKGVERLEALWSHTDQEIYNKAVDILRDFWDAEEDEEYDDDETAPVEAADGTLAFGVGTPGTSGLDFSGQSGQNGFGFGPAQ